MCSIILKGNDMMYLICRSQPAFLFAHFTKRISIYKFFPNLTPLAVVPFVALRITLIFVVVIIHSFPMFLTVPVTGKIRATSKRARRFKFSWHDISLLDHQKSPQHLRRRLYTVSHVIMVAQSNANITHEFRTLCFQNKKTPNTWLKAFAYFFAIITLPCTK